MLATVAAGQNLRKLGKHPVAFAEADVDPDMPVTCRWFFSVFCISLVTATDTVTQRPLKCCGITQMRNADHSTGLPVAPQVRSLWL